MKWFNRWIANRVKKAQRDEYNSRDYPVASKVVSNEFAIRSDGIRMNLYHANGGYILEFEHYDRRADQINRDLYVIHDADNLGESISQVMTLHLLKNS